MLQWIAIDPYILGSYNREMTLQSVHGERERERGKVKWRKGDSYWREDIDILDNAVAQLPDCVIE